jgi:hypothetical protein
VFALPQATLCSPAVMKIEPFGHSTQTKILMKGFSGFWLNIGKIVFLISGL